MSAEMWMLIGIGAAVLLGVLVLAAFTLIPNRALPSQVGWVPGQGARQGLLNNIVAGI